MLLFKGKYSRFRGLSCKKYVNGKSIIEEKKKTTN